MKPKILIVDDDRNVCKIVSRALTAQKYESIVATDGQKAINVLKKEQIDIVLLDLRLPAFTGEELLRMIKAGYPYTDVIIITAYATIESAIRTLKKGAYDYIIKPMNIDNLLLTLKRCVQKRQLFQELTDEKKMYQKISDLYENLDDLFIGTVRSLGDVIEAKDIYTGGHCERMHKYSSTISDKLNLSNEQKDNLRYAAMLHDIGKIAVPEAILLKPGKLTDTEFDIMKKHTVRGVEILSSIKQLTDSMPGIKYHHERYDGKGYPDGLAGENIPLLGRIVSVADSFDAMTSDRPYRKKVSFQEARNELIRCSGTQFDPKLVRTFTGFIK